MNIRLYNAHILSSTEKAIYSGEIHIKDGLISYVGLDTDMLMDWDRNIDMRGALIMPGFVNCHTHSPMTLLRSYCDDQELKTWLENYIFPIEEHMTEEDCYWGTCLAVLEYLACGTTAIEDMYFHQGSIIKACLDTGIRISAVGTAMDIAGDTDEQLDKLEKNFEKYNTVSPLCSYKLGFHAQYTASDELISGISKLAHKHKAGVCMHLSETRNEVESCSKQFGVTPPKYLNERGIFDFGGNAYHCVYLNDEDIKILKEKKVTVVCNFASNLKLASGIADLTKYIDNGLFVALGTDGAASNNALDMFREIYLAAVLPKYLHGHASVMPAVTALKMATINGMNALGLNGGELKVGKIADLTAIDINLPNIQPLNNLVNNVVYAAGARNVVMTMVNGKILYEYGIYNIGIDPDVIYRNSNKAIERLKSNLSNK